MLTGEAMAEWKSWGKGLPERDHAEAEESDEIPKRPMVDNASGSQFLLGDPFLL